MIFDDTRNNVTVQPADCTCVLFIRALALNRALRELIWLPIRVCPSERFVCGDCCLNFPFGQDQLNSLLSVDTSERDFGSKEF